MKQIKLVLQWVKLVLRIIVTFETFVQSYEKTRHDQKNYKDKYKDKEHDKDKDI